MQVFLPYPDYVKSFDILDKKRCFKQVVEDGQLIKAILTNEPKHIRNHPACRMFARNLGSLIEHHNIGYEICKNKWKINFVKTKLINPEGLLTDKPWWLGEERFHSAHRAALLFKDQLYYSQFNWGEAPKKDYWWPE